MVHANESLLRSYKMNAAHKENITISIMMCQIAHFEPKLAEKGSIQDTFLFFTKIHGKLRVLD